MGLSTLNGHRITEARATLPAWGAWFAEAAVDGEVSLTGAVELKIADLTLKGTVLSGGPAKGRSFFRIVGGAGGWGKELPRRGYKNDAGVKLTTVLGDAAKAVGETVDYGTRSGDRVGPAFARTDGSASLLLGQLAPRAWYIDEAGVTKLGQRPTSTYEGKAVHGQVDLAHGTVTLAAESIASILPGVIVDGLEAVDVEHEATPSGLRSTIWGKQAGSSRRLTAYERIFDALDPNRKFRGVYEYRVGVRSGKRLDMQPVRVSLGMPDLGRVPIRPGVAGCDATIPLGARVLVGFVDANPGRPVILGFEDPESDSFAPESLNVKAGGMVGGEHVATVEGTVLLIHNVFAALGTAIAIAWTGSGIKAALAAAINSALTAQTASAPTGLTEQEAAAAAQVTTMLLGAPGTTSKPYETTISAVTNKTPNVSGSFPSIGSKAVKSG